MKRLVFFLWVQVALIATLFEEDDPSHYYHVNVVSGHLELTFQDVIVKAPHPFSVTRSYSSSGALERSPKDSDLFLKEVRESEWMLQGGWGLLSHTNMLEITGGKKGSKFYVSEPGSSHSITYEFYKRKSHISYFRPKGKEKKTSGNISRRHKSSNTRLKQERRGVAMFARWWETDLQKNL